MWEEGMAQGDSSVLLILKCTGGGGEGNKSWIAVIDTSPHPPKKEGSGNTL